MYKTIVNTPPATEPVTLDEAKAQLRIDSILEDTYISALISAARDRAEKYCNRFFTEQSVTVLYDGPFPSEIKLPYPDLTSVDAVKYTDSNNAIQTVDAADYTEDLEKQVIYQDSSFSADAKSYRVELTTGVPASIDAVKHAILMIVADLYETRVEHIVGTSIAMNDAVKVLLYPYRVELGI